MNKLAILLCTCNSQQFIAEQMDSLTTQSYGNWQLYIHDDQSTDSTTDIIRAYARKDDRIHLLDDDRKRGARDGFLWLLEQVEADYYMFCDHDDVWLPNKVETTLRLMEQQPDREDKPLIACCNLKLVDAELGLIADDYWKDRLYTDSQFNNKYYHLFYNNMPGCTMLINSRAKHVALPWPQDTAMHDSWIAAAVLWRGGRVIWTPEPLILYRQHGHNTIGTSDRSLAQQLCILPELLAKTRVQYHASQPLTGMSYTRFFLLKLYYLMQYHLATVTNKLKK